MDAKTTKHSGTLRGRRVVIIIAVVAVTTLLGACAAGPNAMVDQGPDPAGFWLGLWHGLISPITFLVSLFRSDVNVYEVVNNGNWYDFGFILGVFLIFSGPAGGGAARNWRGGRAR